ncbi:MAG TPA: TIGR03118 family protein [Ktedonobacteraceae bacterium]|nr:TIGR03118 family protein [Ktedonobacteraceae bacterium]
MCARLFSARSWLVAIALTLTLFAIPGMVFVRANTGGGFYQQTNLVSNLPGIAKFTDPNLTNPWGISSAPGGPFWVSDNGSGKSTLYDNKGTPQSLIVTIPAAARGTTATPIGTVFNSDANAFIVSKNGLSGSSIFLFDTEDGTISGWSLGVDMTHAILEVNNASSGAVYKGLAIDSNSSGTFLYAANFHAGTIDVFDKKFAPTKLSGSFTDPYLPQGYAPFDIQNIGGRLYVTYAKQNAQKDGDVPGSGHGFVDVYTTNGHFIKRLVTRGQLDSPWGLALAGDSFGKFSHDLLVGNFGDGHINAFDSNTGAFLGQLTNQRGQPIIIDGLWSLMFGLGGQAGKPNQLFFTAGIHQETDGLFGMIQAM